MTAILTTTVSIFAIAGVAWAARKLLRAPVCPICLGVGGTWLWMLIARSLGYAVDTTMLAILLGGSVAGIAYLAQLAAGTVAVAVEDAVHPGRFVAAYARGAAVDLVCGDEPRTRSSRRFPVPPAASGEQSETVEEQKENAAVLLRKVT